MNSNLTLIIQSHILWNEGECVSKHQDVIHEKSYLHGISHFVEIQHV